MFFLFLFCFVLFCFFTGKCGGVCFCFVLFFYFPHTVGEGVFFSKNFHLLGVKLCIPKGWHVGSYLKGLDQWFFTGGA